MEDAIIEALRNGAGNVTAAARDLGVRRTRLYVLMAQSRRIAATRRHIKATGKPKK